MEDRDDGDDGMTTRRGLPMPMPMPMPVLPLRTALWLAGVKTTGRMATNGCSRRDASVGAESGSRWMSPGDTERDLPALVLVQVLALAHHAPMPVAHRKGLWSEGRDTSRGCSVYCGCEGKPKRRQGGKTTGAHLQAVGGLLHRVSL